jgi:hypothetical protein
MVCNLHMKFDKVLTVEAQDTSLVTCHLSLLSNISLRAICTVLNSNWRTSIISPIPLGGFAYDMPRHDKVKADYGLHKHNMQLT